MTFSRRDLIIGGAAGLAASPLLGSTLGLAQAPAVKYTPEAGASLRMLRWSPFV